MRFKLGYSKQSASTKQEAQRARDAAKAKKPHSLIRAYVHAPAGMAAEAIGRALASFRPLPSAREAIRLTDSFPALVQSQALIHYSAFQEAAKAPEAKAPPVTVADQGKAQDARAAREFSSLPGLDGAWPIIEAPATLEGRRRLMDEIVEGWSQGPQENDRMPAAGAYEEEMRRRIREDWEIVANLLAGAKDKEGPHQDKPADRLITPDRPRASYPAQVRRLAREAQEAARTSGGLSAEALDKWASIYAMLAAALPEIEAREVYANLVRDFSKVTAIPAEKIPDWKSAQAGEGGRA